MNYLDTSYLIKCYVSESGSREVRALLDTQPSFAIGAFAKVEFASAINRLVREQKIPSSAVQTVFSVLLADENDGLWTWVPTTARSFEIAVEAFRSIPPGMYLRTLDALHLVCAREFGCRTVYSNDRHLLQAAPHFGLTGRNILIP